MTELNPWRTGAAFALTFVVGYSICTLLFFLWPGAAVEFLNALFHGLDFHKLEPAAPWSFVAFICTVAIMVIWAFLMGALFAWLHNRLGPRTAVADPKGSP